MDVFDNWYSSCVWYGVMCVCAATFGAVGCMFAYINQSA